MRLRSGVVVIVGSRVLAAGFHAHLILGLAGRAAIVLHARLLLIGADLAARLGMSRSKIRKHNDRCQQHCNSHLHNSPCSARSSGEIEALASISLASLSPARLPGY